MTTTSIILRKFALIIFARNEALTIQTTIHSAEASLRNGDALFVVADNCEDNTAELAAQAGANVFIRNQKLPQGKGAAIRWFLQNHKEFLFRFDYLVILDADSLIKPDFIRDLDQNLPAGVQAAQCLLVPIHYDETPLSTLIAMSELVEQTMFEHLRAVLGLSVRLRGTGMVFNPQLLYDVSRRIDSEVEDIALSLLVAEKKIKVQSIFSLEVYDPKPNEMNAAARQRARWFRGQWDAFWKFRRTIWKILVEDINGWSVTSSLFFKPRWLKILISLIIGFALLHFPALAGIIFSLVALELLLFMIGVLRLPRKWKFLKAMFFLPGFIWMWIKGISLSLKKRPWLRVRETSKSKPALESEIKTLFESPTRHI